MPPKAKTVSAKKAPAAGTSKATTSRAATKSPAAKGPKAGGPTAKKPRVSSKAAALTGTFRHTFFGVPQMDMEGERTDIQIIGGFPWRLWMCRYGGGDHQLWVECLQSEETPVWHCDVDYKITLFDQGYGQRFIQQDEETLTMNRSMIRSEQLERFMDKNQGMEEEYYEDEDEEEDEEREHDGVLQYVDVEVVITVKEAKGDRFRVKPTIDIFTPNDEMYDCALAIGDKKIYVNKQFLAFHSTFFKDLFAQKKKGEEKEVKVDGVTPEDFAILLGYLYRVEDTITLVNWEKLAKMAKQFQIQDVKDGVEFFLMDHYEVAIWSEAKKLLTADKYDMDTYTEMTLEGMSSEYYVEKVKESDEYKEFSKEMKERIEKKAEELKKEKEKK